MLTYPPQLRDADLALVVFQLEFLEAFQLENGTLPGMRRDLLQAARLVLGGERGGEGRFAALFDPPVSDDPVAVRRHQRPGPPFVLHTDSACPGEYDSGDRIELRVAFLGRGIQHLSDFIRTLRGLGRIGLQRGAGTFELVGAFGEDSAGNRTAIWREGVSPEDVAPPVGSLDWWLDAAPACVPGCELRLLTPARLLSGGKPLFRPSFERLFPFILRRVTSMLNAHCGTEFSFDPQRLMLSAARVLSDACLQWEDWRSLGGGGRTLELGGVAGQVHLWGDALEDIAWVLRLGSLLNLGKNASYGCGRYLLLPHGCQPP